MQACPHRPHHKVPCILLSVHLENINEKSLLVLFSYQKKNVVFHHVIQNYIVILKS